jgi:hypothetical protein
MNNIIMEKMKVSPQEMRTYVAINSVDTDDENKINEYTSSFWHPCDHRGVHLTSWQWGFL